MRKYIITFFAGFLLAAIGAGFFIYTSLDSASNYKDQYSELERENKALRESNRIRQAEIDRLGAIAISLESENSKLERINTSYANDIIERQRIIGEAGSLISGSEDAIASLERILELFKKLE